MVTSPGLLKNWVKIILPRIIARFFLEIMSILTILEFFNPMPQGLISMVAKIGFLEFFIAYQRGWHGCACKIGSRRFSSNFCRTSRFFAYKLHLLLFTLRVPGKPRLFRKIELLLNLFKISLNIGWLIQTPFSILGIKIIVLIGKKLQIRMNIC